MEPVVLCALWAMPSLCAKTAPPATLELDAVCATLAISWTLAYASPARSSTPIASSAPTPPSANSAKPDTPPTLALHARWDTSLQRLPLPLSARFARQWVCNAYNAAHLAPARPVLSVLLGRLAVLAMRDTLELDVWSATLVISLPLEVCAVHAQWSVPSALLAQMESVALLAPSDSQEQLVHPVLQATPVLAATPASLGTIPVFPPSTALQLPNV